MRARDFRNRDRDGDRRGVHQPLRRNSRIAWAWLRDIPRHVFEEGFGVGWASAPRGDPPGNPSEATAEFRRHVRSGLGIFESWAGCKPSLGSILVGLDPARLQFPRPERTLLRARPPDSLCCTSELKASLDMSLAIFQFEDSADLADQCQTGRCAFDAPSAYARRQAWDRMEKLIGARRSFECIGGRLTPCGPASIVSSWA